MPLWLTRIIAGLIAGIVMAMVAMMLTPMRGKGMMYPVKFMAGTFQDEAALNGGMGTDMIGLMIHMMMSAALGLIFGLIIAGLNLPGIVTLIVAGIIYALIVFVVNWFGTLPIVESHAPQYVRHALRHDARDLRGRAGLVSRRLSIGSR